ncbi:phenylalanine--tRNA ligase subunit alpha [Candidatus Saccharibacteria bacterium]|nr:phenylalanine--tRNA ligase subunit alpha [Candidatus Saccharibacteria bacterium]
MRYDNEQVRAAAEQLRGKFESLEEKQAIRRAPELTALYEQIKTMSPEKRASFGKEVNALKDEVEGWIKDHNLPTLKRPAIDVTAPLDFNSSKPELLPTELGSRHPLMSELEKIIDIFVRMGFAAVESRQLDDDYHMFTSLNFAQDHPARDDYDTFLTHEGLIAPAHTSTMQNRVLKQYKSNLQAGRAISAVIAGRVFRNEDLDARHEHTFYQLEGLYVGKDINAGNLMATLKIFLEEYYGQALEVKTQPFYFPFTEPSFEFALSCPFCKKKGCNICSYSGWIELLGCGMIHPNVLKEAGIDPAVYTGFAWGGGIDRLVMMKNGIEDVRNFHSGNLNFLRQFS